ncbi:hypothetical protein [Sphingomonas sp. SORGH_AS_0879]|uniref:hypothetical protein n=1 Tax=Sphingomonas sp. SORGH_AS_0879 TaxID=3041790 RepID=UPI00278AE923|nr:hypothetical protein [Sphingomonas sp. SORGH_AS_0879]MDQ1229288.1 hypothetical protein [Sphingomonas sp. SORGH_AS_0879]
MNGKLTALLASMVIGGGAAIASSTLFFDEQPDLAACEAHVRANLPAGQDFRRLDVTREDTPALTPAAYREQAGASASVHGLGEAERLRDLLDDMKAEAGKLALRRMVLTYQLAGETPPRQQICAFRLVEGKLESAKALHEQATTVTGKALDTLADLQKRPRQSRPKYSCCL